MRNAIELEPQKQRAVDVALAELHAQLDDMVDGLKYQTAERVAELIDELVRLRIREALETK